MPPGLRLAHRRRSRLDQGGVLVFDVDVRCQRRQLEQKWAPVGTGRSADLQRRRTARKARSAQGRDG